MRSIRARLGLCLLAGMLAVTGCGTDTSTGSSAAPILGATIDEVTAAVGKTLSGTGQLVERQTMVLGRDGTFDWTSTADFDGPAGTHRAVAAFAANPPELGRMITGDATVALTDLTAEVMRVGDQVYMTMRGWPPKLRGRWLAMPLAQAATMMASQGVQVETTARTPSRLIALIESGKATVSRSGTTFQLTVSAPDAMPALGTAAARMFARQNLDMSALKGTVTVDVALDAQGRIVIVRMDATDLMGQLVELAGVKLPPGGVKTTIEAQFTNFGKAVSIAAPPADKLIDPAEMGR
nr:hypothetical protein [Kibdelosporangium sp. MJ126-NF4]CEL23074.1 hypothetical protein [Kibdelosporangium sp. MJ126-NF4]CTQ90212.1 hypothetical protein [Kibdelosporangium sp. MJ126-NF4]